MAAFFGADIDKAILIELSSTLLYPKRLKPVLILCSKSSRYCKAFLSSLPSAVRGNSSTKLMALGAFTPPSFALL